jgi:4-hydroxy-3-methylbut-2-enyl diphosphate reductase
MFFVIGSKNSSNSVRLVEVAKKAGCLNSELVHTEKNLPIEKIKRCKRIGVASGASAPERLVQDLISEIKEHCNVSLEEVVVAEEKVVFKLPKTVN